MTEMFDAIDRGELTTMFVLGENPIQSDADATHVKHLFDKLEHVVVQDIFLHEDGRGRRRRAARLGELVRGRGHGHELRAARPARPRGARSRPARRATTCASSSTSPPAWATSGSTARREDVWNELRSLAPNHAGMSYERLEELGGIQWPCFTEDELEPSFLHGRLWKDPRRGPAGRVPRGRGRPADRGALGRSSRCA